MKEREEGGGETARKGERQIREREERERREGGRQRERERDKSGRERREGGRQRKRERDKSGREETVHANFKQLSFTQDRLFGPVVKESASRAADPRFDSRLRREFSGRVIPVT